MIAFIITDVEEIKKDPKRTEEFLVLSQTLRVFVGDDWPMPGASELLQVFGKVCRCTILFKDHFCLSFYNMAR